MGSTWASPASGTTSNLFKVKCLGTTCYAAGSSGTVLKTSNGGTSWTSLPTGSSATFASVAISPSGSGVWIGGNIGTGSIIMYSANGGTSWTTQATGAGATCIVQDIVMLSDLVGWAACANTASNTGALLYTNSGGR